MWKCVLNNLVPTVEVWKCGNVSGITKLSTGQVWKSVLNNYERYQMRKSGDVSYV